MADSQVEPVEAQWRPFRSVTVILTFGVMVGSPCLSCWSMLGGWKWVGPAISNSQPGAIRHRLARPGHSGNPSEGKRFRTLGQAHPTGSQGHRGSVVRE